MATEGTFEMLLSRDPPPSLQPRTAFSEAAAQQIKGLAAAGIHQNVIAVLDLLNDDLEACHQNVQVREGDSTADLMHATLHRREGDFWNSKWWLSRISHPVIESIYGDTRGAKDFVDQVDKVTEKVKQTGDRDPLAALEQKQKEELAALAKFVQDNYLNKNEQT